MSLADVRPRSVTEIVDATFTFYRANFATVLTLALLFMAPAAILKIIVPGDWEKVVEYAGNLLVPIAEGAIAVVVAAAVERGERLDVAGGLSGIRGRAGSLIAVRIASGFLMVIGFVLLVIPGIIAIIWTSVGIQSAAIEKLGYSRAIERSRDLVRGHWGKALGTLILAWAVSLLLLLGGGFVAGFSGVGDRIGSFVLDFLFAAVLPIPAIAMTLVYYDLRVRRESADLEAMVSELSAAAPTG